MSQGARWPGFLDYMDAVQAPRLCFASQRLQAARVATNALGIPYAATGKSAIVFRASAGSREIALRCFTREASRQRLRYQALHKYLANPPDYMVDFVYRDHEILISGIRYPIVEMGWAQGESLSEWIKRNLGHRGELANLAATWLRIMNDLQARNLAHGDLANDNCLVQGGNLKLIDYDGCFIPPLAGSDPAEAGNQHFQHPDRAGYYALNMDAFPALVVYLSLLALDSDESLWRFHIGENVIFTAQDYRSPWRTPLWSELAHGSDSRVTALASTLAEMCEASIDSLPPLSDLVAGRSSTSSNSDSPWWESWAPPSAPARPVQDPHGEAWWESAFGNGQESTPPRRPAPSTGGSWLEDQLIAQGSHYGRASSTSPLPAVPVPAAVRAASAPRRHEPRPLLLVAFAVLVLAVVVVLVVVLLGQSTAHPAVATPGAPACPSSVARDLPSGAGAGSTLIGISTTSTYTITLCKSTSGQIFYHGVNKRRPSLQITLLAHRINAGYLAVNGAYEYEVTSSWLIAKEHGRALLRQRLQEVKGAGASGMR